MMDARSKRHKYSRHVDYAVLQTIYAGEDDSSQAGSPSATSREASRSVSATPSKRKVSFEDEAGVRSPSVTPSVAESATAGVVKEVGENMDADEDDDEASVADSLPVFGEEEDYEMDYYDDEDELSVAHEYGVDTGDG
jgi:hypothetical protein